METEKGVSFMTGSDIVRLSAEELTRRCDFTIRNDLHQSDVAEQVRRVAAGIREKRGERT